MGAFTAAERDALAKDIFTRICQREHYDKRGGDRSGNAGGQWVTIGGGAGPGGQKHAGGTPVKIGPGGEIAAGPKGLKGEQIDQVDKNKDGGAEPPQPSPVPGAPKVGGPNVTTAEHGKVKQALGHPDTLAAYYHDGAHYFLHDDAAKAQKVLGATAVTHEGLPDALNKLVKAGHRVGLASPADEKPPRQKPQPKAQNFDQAADLEKPAAEAKPEPAPPPSEATPAARPGEAPPDSPAGEQAAGPANPAPGSADNVTDSPPAADNAAKPDSASKDTAALDRHRQLNRERQQRFREKQKNAPLAEKLKKDGPEAREMPTAAAIARGIGPHRLKNEHGEQPPAGVSVGPGGIWTGTATLHADDIQMDPARFQYKVSGIGKSGVTKQLSDVKRFNPMFGGQILVWRDPKDGKSYVINGHHRVELAKRSGPYQDEKTGLNWNGEMQSFYIPAKTPEQARAWGAIANMAAGHGTATDAAKYLRDSGDTIEGLQAHGVSIKGKLASDALQLKDLSRRAFDDLVGGVLPESRAVAVAQHLKDPEAQDRIFRKLADRERDGRPVTDQAAAAAAKVSALAGTSKGGGGPSLFGDDDGEDSLEVEYGEIIDAATRALTSERNTFKAVTSAKRAGKLAEGGNVLDTEANKQRAHSAENTLDLFNKLAYLKGDVASSIKTAAEKLHRAPDQRKDILADFVRELPGTLERQFQGGERYSAEAQRSGARGNPSRSGGPAGEGRSGTGHAGAGAVRSDQVWRQQLIDALRPAVGQVVEQYAAVWDEAKHPRGQPENAGEFAPVGSHAATSSADYHPPKKLAPSPWNPATSTVQGKDLRASLESGRSPHQAVAENLVSNSRTVATIERHYPPANPTGADTLERHRGAGGKFTPQRQALHDKIVAEIRGNVPASNDKSYFMMGGGPASGKSSIIAAGLVTLPQAVHVDADAIKTRLPEYQALVAEKDQRAAGFAHEESSHLGKSIVKQSLAAGQNVLLDGTGNSSYEALSDKVKQARASGYKVNAEYTTCSTDEAIRRNVERAKKTGRLPPESMLRAVHQGVSAVLPRAAQEGLFDSVRLWDTEHHDANGKPTLVMSGLGTQVTIHHPELWAAFQAKANA